MKDNEIDQFILAAAEMKGIEVVIAKHRSVVKQSGIHIMNPTHDDIIEALCKALALDLGLVICYIRPLD